VNCLLFAYGHLQATAARTLYTAELHLSYPDAGYPDRLGPPGKSVENSTNLTRLEITGYRIKHSTVLWRLELQIRRGRKFQTQVLYVLREGQSTENLKN